MTSVMVMKLQCSNPPVNFGGCLDGTVKNRALISIVGKPTLLTRQDNIGFWMPGGTDELEDIEGIIMATSNGVAKGATALGSVSSAITWSNNSITYGNAPSSGNVEILLVGRLKQ